jgi:hypothetical protein
MLTSMFHKHIWFSGERLLAALKKAEQTKQRNTNSLQEQLQFAKGIVINMIVRMLHINKNKI